MGNIPNSLTRDVSLEVVDGGVLFLTVLRLGCMKLRDVAGHARARIAYDIIRHGISRDLQFQYNVRVWCCIQNTSLQRHAYQLIGYSPAQMPVAGRRLDMRDAH